jgi:hypothetical protein
VVAGGTQPLPRLVRFDSRAHLLTQRASPRCSSSGCRLRCDPRCRESSSRSPSGSSASRQYLDPAQDSPAICSATNDLDWKDQGTERRSRRRFPDSPRAAARRRDRNHLRRRRVPTPALAHPCHRPDRRRCLQCASPAQPTWTAASPSDVPRRPQSRRHDPRPLASASRVARKLHFTMGGDGLEPPTLCV